MNKFFIFIILFLNSINYLFAQECQIEGTVIDAKTKEAIPGISITIKGSNKMTFSDIDGKYSIRADCPHGTLVFSFPGYKTQTIELFNRIHIDVEMQYDIPNLHTTLICANAFLEPGVTTANYFPYGISSDLKYKKLMPCCYARYKLILGAFYGTDFRSNEIFHSRVGLNFIKIAKARLGATMDYNRLKISEIERDTLIADYRFNISLDRFLKYFACEFGLGKQKYNTLINNGLGGSFLISNDLDLFYPKFRYEFYAGFWSWKSYDEYCIGLRLSMYTKKEITESNFKRIKFGCELRQIDKIKFVSFTMSFNFIIKRGFACCD